MIPRNLTERDILSAIKKVNKTGIPSLRHSKDYSLLYENIHLPAKIFDWFSKRI